MNENVRYDRKCPKELSEQSLQAYASNQNNQHRCISTINSSIPGERLIVHAYSTKGWCFSGSPQKLAWHPTEIFIKQNCLLILCLQKNMHILHFLLYDYAFPRKPHFRVRIECTKYITTIY